VYSYIFEEPLVFVMSESDLEAFQKIKTQLQKAVDDDDMPALHIVLNDLSAFDISSDTLIKKTKIGGTLKTLKTKYSKSQKDVAKQITDILKKWTKIARSSTATKDKNATGATGSKRKREEIEGSQPETTAASSADNASSHEKVSRTEADTSEPPSKAHKESHEKKSASSKTALDDLELPAGRLKIITTFSKILTNVSQEHSIDLSKMQSSIQDTCKSIEFHVNKSTSYLQEDGKTNPAYTAKARSLLFNLKKNKNLLLHLSTNTLQPSYLVSMNANELADPELMNKRLALQDEERESRRTDWMEANKTSLMEKFGLDNSDDKIRLEEEVQEISDAD